MNKAQQVLTIMHFVEESLVGRKFRLRGGYDIEVVSHTGEQIVACKLINERKSPEIKKYKLNNLEYLILKEL